LTIATASAPDLGIASSEKVIFIHASPERKKNGKTNAAHHIGICNKKKGKHSAIK
jgi:hypothetical protein